MDLLNRFQIRVADERGTGIVTAITISLVVFILGTVWTGVAVHQVGSSSYERYREQALDAAEAGINYAMSQVAGDLHWAGTAAVFELGDGTGEFEVTVSPLDPNDPDDLDRYIVAKGYAPSKTAQRRAARQLEQQIEMIPSDGFNFALFASPGGISGNNNSTVTGDVYSAADINLNQYAKIFGDVSSVGSVTTGNNSTIGGKVHAGVNATIQNSQTTVQGDVLAGGVSFTNPNAVIGGRVDGNVQAGGTVSVSGGSVGGTVTQNSPPAAPPVLAQPTFTWNPANYPSTSTWTSASNFISYWSANKNAFSGHHRIQGGDDSSNKITLGDRWTMTGDVTLVANGPVVLSRDIVNATSGDVTLSIVSFSTRDPAIQFSNNVTMASSVKILLFAPDGVIDFSQLKDFHGAVYGKQIRLSQQFTLTHFPVTVPGFVWDASSAVHFDVEARTFREVTFTP